MPNEHIARWMKSGKYAKIASMSLRPRKHPTAPDMPLSVQRGQAEVFFLEDPDQKVWILKQFGPGKLPSLEYLRRISFVLPRHKPLSSGTQREVLSPTSLAKNRGHYHCLELARELKDTVLMPKIEGMDWSAMADGIRENTIQLSPEKRLLLCKHLSATVMLLENNDISHRDLSGGNVFLSSRGISLIDFDSLYHPSLTMPVPTTIGSDGYTAPFVSQDNETWRPCADRFALALLNIELLILNRRSPFSHEGGIFDQEDIYNRSGSTIRYAEGVLERKYPKAIGLLKAVINSTSFRDCPSPKYWMSFCSDPKHVAGIKYTPKNKHVVRIMPKHDYKTPTPSFNRRPCNVAVSSMPNPGLTVPKTYITSLLCMPGDDIAILDSWHQATRRMDTLFPSSHTLHNNTQAAIASLSQVALEIPKKPAVHIPIPGNPWEIKI